MSEVMIKKKNVIWDATSLSSFMNCEQYYDIRFNHRLVPMRGPSNSLEIGILIHKVLEVYYQHKKNGFPRATCIGQAMAAGQMMVIGCPHCSDITIENPTCGHSQGEYPGLHNTNELSEGYKTGWRFALDTCEQYFDIYKNDSFSVLQVEWVDKKILYEDDEIRVLWKAKFDLVTDNEQIGIVSMDHKTFKQRREKSSLNNQIIGQALLLKARQVIINKIGLQSTQKAADRLSREVIPISADRLDEWQNQTLPYYAYKFIDSVESERWTHNYTSCDSMYGPCAYKNVCEADRNMRGEILQNDYMMVPIWDPKNREDAE